MTRERVEALAKDLYTEDEIKILLKGYDLGFAQASKEITNKILLHLEQVKKEL